MEGERLSDDAVSRHLFDKKLIVADNSTPSGLRLKSKAFNPSLTVADDLGQRFIKNNSGVSVTIHKRLNDLELIAEGKKVLAIRAINTPTQTFQLVGRAVLQVDRLNIEAKPLYVVEIPKPNVVNHGEIQGWPEPVNSQADYLELKGTLARLAAVVVYPHDVV